jgi:hypothetical protein
VVEDDDACDDAMSTHPAPPTSPTQPRPPNLGEISSNRRPAGPASAAAGSDRARRRGEIWRRGRIRDWDRGGEGGFALPLGPQIFLGLPPLRLPRLIFGACFVLCCLPSWPVSVESDQLSFFLFFACCCCCAAVASSRSHALVLVASRISWWFLPGDNSLTLQVWFACASNPCRKRELKSMNGKEPKRLYTSSYLCTS